MKLITLLYELCLSNWSGAATIKYRGRCSQASLEVVTLHLLHILVYHQGDYNIEIQYKGNV